MRKLGLALGGGGARGLAHIGILKVLEAEGIPVSCVAGTSMGGIIGALFAQGHPIAEMEAIALQLSKLSELMKLVDVNPPRRGLLEGVRVQAYLQKLLGRYCTFEELNIPLCLTAVDIITAKEVVLSGGPLLPAVMATSAFPGLLPPREMDGMLLVDGGVLNNVPADHAREIGAEIVLAVDVQHNPCNEPPWQFLPHRPRWVQTLPELFLDFYRSELIMIAAMTRQRLAAAKPEIELHPCIPPDITMFLGFTRAVELIRIGEESCRAILPRLLELVLD